MSLSGLRVPVAATLLTLLAGAVVGQDPPAAVPDKAEPKIDLAARARTLVERALEEGRAYSLLRQLTEVAPKRLSGSPGAARAVAWGRATMARLGLRNVRLQRVMVPRWVRGDTAELSVVPPG